MQKENPVGWFEIYVDDMNRATKFYETVFETTLTPLPDPTNGKGLEMLSFPMSTEKLGSPGALVHVEGMKAGGNSTIVYFSSEDCAVEEGRVKEAGGKIHTPRMSIGEFGFIVHALDTEGNLIGIHSQK